jgi:hypothetical protein
MKLDLSLRNLPLRLATGAFILNSGLGKRDVPPERAAGLHGMAAGAYPMLSGVEPARFVKTLSTAEIAIGTCLLAPIVPPRLAGLLLTGFAGGLVGMYLRTPDLREPGSIRPNANGTAIAKDVWMLGAGLSLLAASRRGR